MSQTTAPVTATELRRRVREAEALQMKVRELAAEKVLTSREAAAAAARTKEEADLAAREAAAVALRLFGDADLVAGLLDVPVEELEREAKAVTAGRAKEIIESLRVYAARPRAPRRARTSRTADPEVGPATEQVSNGGLRPTADSGTSAG
ncbi:hypothetical protein ACFYXL_14325 [Streptomyces tsukubensis]|uniref:hypothetical protein n=1 Tax=Streptomyces tsukubensis TaxID=83656 RepID=UPI0036B51182